MNITRTIKIKLDIPKKDILPVLQDYTKAYNFICQLGYDTKNYNAISLHNKTYSITSQYLPSQLACSSRTKAVESLKSYKELKRKTEIENRYRIKYNQTHQNKPKKLLTMPSCPQSKLSSIRYDKNSYTIWFEKEKLSLLTLNGRIVIPIKVPEYFKQYITWKRSSAELLYRPNGIFFHITLQKEFTDIPKNNIVIGIDRGIKKLAVCSDKRFFGGSYIKQITNKYENLRSKLQSVQTKSAKRHLKKISKKVNSFRRDVNHCISKQIVSSIPEGSTIVLEDLTNIRQRIRLRKKERSDFHKWGFYQLEEFIRYKSFFKGISIEYVSANYTSQKCSKCGHIIKSNRKSQSQFCCKKCHYQLNSDLNASFNIRNNYLDSISYLSRADVNPPNRASGSNAL